jgi:hypothetical protein
MAARVKIMISLPDPYSPAPAIVAATAHVGRIIRLSEAAGKPVQSDLRVVVATDDYRIRGLYRRLGIEGVQLHELAPAAVATDNGRLSVLTKSTDGRAWGTAFVTRVQDFPKNVRPDLVVVTLPFDGHQQLLTLDAPVIFISRDPGHPTVRSLARLLPCFGWSREDLTDMHGSVAFKGFALRAAARRLEAIAAEQDPFVELVTDTNIGRESANFWADIAMPMQASSSSLFTREFVKATYGLFYDLLHLCVPLAEFEQQGGRVKERLSDLRATAGFAPGDLGTVHLPVIVSELEAIADALADRSPKGARLLAKVAEVRDLGRSVLIVTRSARLVGSLSRALLAEGFQEPGVRVRSVHQVADELPADQALLTGIMPQSLRQTYIAGLASVTGILAYAGRGDPAGASEASLVESVSRYQLQMERWLADPGFKAAAWKAVSGEKTPHLLTPAAPAPVLRIGPIKPDRDEPPGDDPRVQSLPDLWEGTLDVAKVLASVLVADEESVLSQETEDGSGRRVAVSATRVDLTDGRWLLLDADGLVTKLSAAGPDEAYPVARLLAGDQLLIIDGQARKNLLGKLLEVASDMPELAEPVRWVSEWRLALRRAYAAYGTYADLTLALHALGCIRSSAAVRNWVFGLTIGPEDPQDVRRLGECIKDGSIVTNWHLINASMERIRGAHRRLGHRLTGLAVGAAGAAHSGSLDHDEVVDDKSGLTAGDFARAVEAVVVRGRTSVGPVPWAVTGILFQQGLALNKVL